MAVILGLFHVHKDLMGFSEVFCTLTITLSLFPVMEPKLFPPWLAPPLPLVVSLVKEWKETSGAQWPRLTQMTYTSGDFLGHALQCPPAPCRPALPHCPQSFSSTVLHLTPTLTPEHGNALLLSLYPNQS